MANIGVTQLDSIPDISHILNSPDTISLQYEGYKKERTALLKSLITKLNKTPTKNRSAREALQGRIVSVENDDGDPETGLMPPFLDDPETLLIGDWKQNRHGKFDPDKKGENGYSAIVFDTHVIWVLWSKNKKRCGPANGHTGYGDLTTSGRFVAYDLPKNIFEA